MFNSLVAFPLLLWLSLSPLQFLHALEKYEYDSDLKLFRLILMQELSGKRERGIERGE